MRVFDASSIIYAWDNYPPEIFPKLWKWIGTQISAYEIAIPEVVYGEVNDKTPQCTSWLRAQGIQKIQMSGAILQDALRIKHAIGVRGEKYHPKGVGENDLLIIATARAEGSILVTDEEKQLNLPKEPTKVKIPAVCSRSDVGVSCECFLEYIKQAQQVFG